MQRPPPCWIPCFSVAGTADRDVTRYSRKPDNKLVHDWADVKTAVQSYGTVQCLLFVDPIKASSQFFLPWAEQCGQDNCARLGRWILQQSDEHSKEEACGRCILTGLKMASGSTRLVRLHRGHQERGPRVADFEGCCAAIQSISKKEWLQGRWANECIPSTSASQSRTKGHARVAAGTCTP